MNRRMIIAVAVLAAGCCCRPGPSGMRGTRQGEYSRVAMQNSLHEGLKQFPELYRNAPNEIKKSEIYRSANEWRKEFAVKNGCGIAAWEGIVSDISTTKGGGMASVSIKSEFAGFRIFFKSGMRIEQGSKLYAMIEPLREGANVVFSGSFIKDDVKGYREVSLTERGSLDEPEFEVDFTEIRTSGGQGGG